MADEPKTSSTIKVVDRRWFTEKGEPRAGATVDGPPASAARGPETTVDRAPEADPSSVASSPSASGAERSRKQGGGPVLGFTDMIGFLAQQAVVLLHGAEGLPKSPEQARLFIDFLVILEEKTAGNLSPDEARVLSDLLYQLRTLYIQASA